MHVPGQGADRMAIGVACYQPARSARIGKIPQV